jgi:hypothetical protein
MAKLEKGLAGTCSEQIQQKCQQNVKTAARRKWPNYLILWWVYQGSNLGPAD